MDRFKILTDAEAFKKAFPNKAEFVVSESIVELLTLYLEIRTDFDYLAILKLPFDEFYDKLINWLGDTKNPTSKNDCGIIEGCVYWNTSVSKEDAECVYKLLKMQTKFQSTLYSIHPVGIQQFIAAESGKLCGNVLYHCSDTEFIAVMESIDIPFTTVSNLLTAIRSDLLNDTERYGRIRTSKDVLLVDLLQSTDSCIGVYASKLKGD